LGLPSIAFTEHADLTAWSIPAREVATMPPAYQSHVGNDGLFRPPSFDIDGYAASIELCRERFPELRIRSGIELGEAHRHADDVHSLLAAYSFDVVIGSLHSLAEDDTFLVVDRTFSRWPAADVVRRYLAEVLRLVRDSDRFAVLGHVDYPLRCWPKESGPVDSAMFEEEYRAVFEELAESGRALEVNTRLPASGALLSWWIDAGGRHLTFGSDAHDPERVGHDFAEAAAVAEAAGFRPAGDDWLWFRA